MQTLLTGSMMLTVGERDFMRSVDRVVREGSMWERDHLRPLRWDEYEYWMRTALPMGWSIVAKPQIIGYRAARSAKEESGEQ